MKKIIAFCALAFLSNFAFAADYTVRIKNETGYNIYELYVSPENSDDWEENLIDQDEYLGQNQDIEIALPDYDSPLFDFMAIDEDGDEYTIYDVNVAENDISLSPSNRVN